MATENQIAKSRKKPKFTSRTVNRCWRCGRNRGYMRAFDLCRICFRELVSQGQVPGIRKSSW